MTLDEIIAGMEHLENLKQVDGDRITGVVKQLVAFRAELKELVEKWCREAIEHNRCAPEMAQPRNFLRECAAELRDKIGEKR